MSGKDLTLKEGSAVAEAYGLKNSVMIRIFKKYEGSVLFPYLVWAVNLLGGGTIDRIASNHVATYNIKRLDALFDHLARKVDRNAPDPESEEFMAALHVCVTALMDSTSKKKAKYFAAILAHAWIDTPLEWDELSQVLKLIKELEDTHIIILKIAYNLRQRGTEIGPGYFSLGRTSPSAPGLDAIRPDLNLNLLQMCISDLVSKGLINDSFESNSTPLYAGATQLETRPGELLFQLSELGLWFIDQLKGTDTDDTEAPEPIV